MNLKIFTNNIEPQALSQIYTLISQPAFSDCKVRIMPDVHAGAGCVIGFTADLGDMVVPNLVGVDIGCGMLTVDVGTRPIDLPALDAACHEVPSGPHVWEGRRERFDLEELRCHRQLKDTKRLGRSLGTLGGGNHFIEVDVDTNGTQHLVIHSGSRNLGTQVANYYQRLAVELHQGKEEYFERRDALIAEYKAAGRRKEIQSVLKSLRWDSHEPDAPAELCWLYGSYLDDYLHDVAVCQRFARRNREVMAREICQRAGLEPGDAFHTVHNYIDTDEMILRKGAIAAHAGELVLIPLNMRDGSVLARGRGNADWNFSAPHGAGRLMSRADARERLSMDDYRAAMAGVYTTSVTERTLDEAPAAYKAGDDIIGPIAASVDVLDVMRPIYNFKAQ